MSSRKKVLIITAASLFLLFSMIWILLRGFYISGYLEPSSPEPQGSRALVTVLRKNGTEVTERRSVRGAVKDLEKGNTLLITSPSTLSRRQLAYLEEHLQSDTAKKGRIVLVSPNQQVLSIMAPDIWPAATVDDPDAAAQGEQCMLNTRARRISAGSPTSHRKSLRDKLIKEYPGVLFSVHGSANACFLHDSQVSVAKQGRVVVVGSGAPFTNRLLASQDNAAFALNLLSQGKPVTWYLPSPDDPSSDPGSSVVDYLPSAINPFVDGLTLPVLLLLIASWHRLGPVVREPLPVTVPAAELTRSRAQLMMRFRQRERAAHELRAKTRRELVTLLGGPASASSEEQIAFLQKASPKNSGRLRELLTDSPIKNNSELRQLAEDLIHLEKETRRDR
ncbi:DUF4350 domain-containing protein [Dermabacteraceae bacterium TAE3-ERU27]|nr:DUF4350 domain-containing protein [Dermabacteraceae bacterium TAE3-ERU27]